MSHLRSKSRRGAALLIVLACLIIAVTASTILVGMAATLNAQVQLNSCALISNDMLRAAEAPIQNWLANESSKVVLPPDLDAPVVKVLHDRWCVTRGGSPGGSGVGGGDCELTITAWDQCGMVPIEAPRSGSPLRMVLPEECLRGLDVIDRSPDELLGLDWFVTPREVYGAVTSPFPIASDSSAFQFGDTSRQLQPRDIQTQSPSSSPLRFGALIATHNPGQRNPSTGPAGGDPGRVNVNTAPIKLVEAALRAAGRGGLDQIVDARRQGKPASSGNSNSDRGQAQRPFAPEIVGSSSSWSFRIDIRVGPLRQSWWAVYQPKRKPPPSKDSKHKTLWECEQRLAITS